MDALVPAYNEAPTVGDVVRALVASGVFGRVLVVNDGSTDMTSVIARRAGATVIDLHPNRGKAEAMLAGLTHCRGDVAFFDADLVGLTEEHVHLLVDHFRTGQFDQVCALQDLGILGIRQPWIAVAAFSPIIAGQRVVSRRVLDRVPESCWRGYAIEVVINYLVDSSGGTTCLVPLPGLSFRNKTQKVGFFVGWLGHLRMARQMRDAARSLAETGGTQCRVR